MTAINQHLADASAHVPLWYFRAVARSNVEILKSVLQAFNDGRLDEVRRSCSPDVKYTIRGRGPLAGTYEGVDAFTDALGRVKQLTDGTMAAEPQVLLAGDEVIMMYARVTGRRADGRTYDNFQAYLYRFRDRLLIEGQTIPVDQHAFDSFTS